MLYPLTTLRKRLRKIFDLMNKNKFVAWFTPGRLVVILVVLLVRPSGLFGTAKVERV